MAPVTPALWQTAEQKIVTNVISVKQTKEAMDTVRKCRCHRSCPFLLNISQTQRLLETFLAEVEANEPGCELFMLNRDDERFQFVTYEM